MGKRSRNETQETRKKSKQPVEKDTAAAAVDEDTAAAQPVVIARPGSSDRKSSPRWSNRQRTLVFSSRGISYRSRHLMDDLRALMPHSKKDAKMDRKDQLGEIVPEICEMKNCNNCLYFEMRKKMDLYMWMGKMPHGPTAKFLVQNVHTMDELKMTGNCLKGSRPVLNFDSSFDDLPQLRIIKELLFQSFGTPQAHPKSKPFVDRIMSFYWLDGRIWIRNYQIVWSEDPKTPDEHELAEIGPRCVLLPIRIFAGAFGGKTLYENENYVSPNEYRREFKAKAAQKFADRKLSEKRQAVKRVESTLEEDEMDRVFHDAAEAAQ